MAKCPNCSYKLKPWDIKAECPSCKTNIPNYNWDVRLEEDAARSEAAFKMLNLRTSNVKSCLFGSKLRKIRFILTFTPLILLILPLVSYQANLPYISESMQTSLLSAVLWIVKNSLDISAIIQLIKSDIIGRPILLLVLGIAFFVLSILFAVISFILLIIKSLNLSNRNNIICNAISIVLSITSAICFSISFSELAKTTVNFIENPSVGIAIFIALALYLINMILNILTEKSLKPQRTEFKTKRKELSKYI